MSEAIVSFQPAVRKGSHVLIALYGESGSGKTYSALQIARGIAGKAGRIGVLDTETGRALVYANEAGGWLHAELTSPFTPERYVAAINAAEEAKLDVLIIDSASHEWEGIGGIIEMADATGKVGLLKWADPKARHKRFLKRLLSSRMHIIICLRAKEKMTQSRDGKITNEGYVSIQDRRFIFEMTVQLFMHHEPGKRGQFIVEKCPKDLLPAFTEGQPADQSIGEKIAAWVSQAEPINHELMTLKLAGEDWAEQGTQPLQQWFLKLDKAQKLAMQPYMANLKSAAATADGEAKEVAIARTNTDDLADGLAPAAGADNDDNPAKFLAAG